MLNLPKKNIMKSVLTLVETVEIAWEMKKPKFWTFSIGYLSLYPFFTIP